MLRKTAQSVFLFILLLLPATQAISQDWIRTGTNRGAAVRLAVPDFKQAGTDPQSAPLLTTFNETLWNDLENAGIFEMVARSYYPLLVPGNPNEMKLPPWANPPANASMVAFGNLGVGGGKVDVLGWLFDVKNTAFPQVLGKQYREDASVDNARVIAHRFANEIISRLGGIPGITESKIFFISTRSNAKEVWSMDYDGANQKQLTRLGSIALAPQPSPDGSRVGFTGLGKDSWQIMMYSMDLSRIVAFPRYAGDTFSHGWSSD